MDEQIENATIVIKQLNDKIVLLENQNEQLEARNSKLTIDLQEEQNRLESLAIRMMETHKYSGSLEEENEDVID